MAPHLTALSVLLVLLVVIADKEACERRARRHRAFMRVLAGGDVERFRQACQPLVDAHTAATYPPSTPIAPPDPEAARRALRHAPGSRVVVVAGTWTPNRISSAA